MRDKPLRSAFEPSNASFSERSTPSALRHGHLAYRAEIDGLLALAVLAVILFHAGIGWFKGGYVGVDVFFVISGYLITSILLREQASGTFSIARFYERRVRRILPALVLVMAACLPWAWLLMTPEEFGGFGSSLIAVPAFISNILFWRTSGYFDTASEEKPLLHTWSLAVEEQFYVVFPLLIAVVWRYRADALKTVVVLLFLASFLFSEWGWRDDLTARFYLAPTRAWELLLGALVALGSRTDRVRERIGGPAADAIAAIGLLAVVAPVFLYDRQTPFPGVYALPPTVGTALVIAFAHPATFVGRLLATRWIVLIGLISYSAYLWHQPIFAFARMAFPDLAGPRTMALLVPLALGLAWLSWRYIETPFRKSGFLTRRQLFVAATAASVLFMGLGYAARQNAIVPYLFKDLDLTDSQYGGKGYIGEGSRLLGAEGAPKRFTVYGDSHAIQYLGALEEVARKEGFSFDRLTHSACFSFPNLTNVYQGSVHERCIGMLGSLEEKLDRSDAALILAYRWGKQLARPDGSRLDLTGRDPAGQEEVLQALDRLISEMGTHRQYILVGNVPSTNLIAEGGYLKCLAQRRGECPRSFSREEGELFDFNRKLRAFAKARPNVRFIDPYDALCDERECHVVWNGRLLYSDHAHLSLYGARLVIEHFRSELLEQPVGGH